MHQLFLVLLVLLLGRSLHRRPSRRKGIRDLRIKV